MLFHKKVPIRRYIFITLIKITVIYCYMQQFSDNLSPYINYIGILWKYIALNCFFNPEMLKQFLYIKYLAWICNSLCRSLSNATICRCITYSKYLLHDKSIQLRECSPKLQLTAFYDTNLISLFILPGYNSYYLGNMNNGSGYNLFFFLFDNINSVHWRVWNFTMHVKYLYMA